LIPAVIFIISAHLLNFGFAGHMVMPMPMIAIIDLFAGWRDVSFLYK
jgi:hypothetical protein